MPMTKRVTPRGPQGIELTRQRAAAPAKGRMGDQSSRCMGFIRKNRSKAYEPPQVQAQQDVLLAQLLGCVLQPT